MHIFCRLVCVCLGGVYECNYQVPGPLLYVQHCVEVQVSKWPRALAAMACDYNGYIFLDDPIPDPAQTPAAHPGTLSTFYVCTVASLSFGLLMLCCHRSRRDEPVAVRSDRLRGCSFSEIAFGFKGSHAVS